VDVKNFPTSNVLNAPSPTTSGTSVTVLSGEGVRFALGRAFVAPALSTATPVNAEVIDVIAITGDVLTVTRAVENSASRAIGVGDVIYQGVSAGMWDALPQRASGSTATAARLPMVNVADHGWASSATSAANQLALQDAVSQALSLGVRMVAIPGGSYDCAPGTVTTDRALRIVGSSRARTTVRMPSAGTWLTNGADTAVTRADGAMSSASTTLIGSGFTAELVSRYIGVAGAGVGGSMLTARVVTFNSSSSVTLATAASTAVGPTATYTVDPWDGVGYDGVESLMLENLNIETLNGVTTLANGTGTYLAGSTAVADWRGGDLQLHRVSIKGFATGVFGVQSDLNTFIGLQLSRCATGMYLGPRSDQPTIIGLYAFDCDRVMHLDMVRGASIYGARFVGNGAAAVNPVRIGSSWSAGSSGISFDASWFEHLQGYSGEIEAFVEIGVDDNVNVISDEVHFRGPTILVNASGSPPRAKYLCKVGSGDNVSVENPSGSRQAASWRNLDRVLTTVGTTSPSLYVKARNALGSSAVLANLNTGSGSPSVTVEQWGALGTAGGFTIAGGGVTAGQATFTGRTSFGAATQTLAANGAVTMNAQSANRHVITLQANATSSSITNPPPSGQSMVLTIEWNQDATGGRTYAWPSNCRFINGAAGPSDTTASRRTNVTFEWDNSAALWLECARSVAVG
jgi:hypothetical protein